MNLFTHNLLILYIISHFFDKIQHKSDKRYKKWNKMQIKENTPLFQILYAENNINNSFDFKWKKVIIRIKIDQYVQYT